MIQPNEIRIGNIIKSPESEFSAITEIGCRENMYYARFKNIHAGYYLEDCNPIPITEDVLLKCGFEKYKMLGYDTHFTYSLFIGGETINITAIYNADFSIMLHGLARGIKYLHRLQNIINIVTGKDLEINL